MTRLAIVHTESSCGWGGQELRILEESAGFLRKGHDVRIIAPPGSKIVEEAKRRSLAIDELPIARRTVTGWVALRRHLGRIRADIVNTHSSTDSWLVACSTMTMHRPPVVVRTRHVSAPIPQNWPSRWLYQYSAAHVVTTGNALRSQLMKETGLNESRVTSVPTGIDLLKFRPGDRNLERNRLQIPQDVFLIGIVATLRSWKGHRFLLEAFATLKDSDIRLAIVGGGPGADNLRQQIFELGLRDKVFLPGNQQDVVPWIRAMDIFVLPSYANEGVPQAIMQAQACGVPVISTPVGSIGELIENGSSGVMVPPRNPSALAEAIAQLKRDSQFRTKLVANALRRAREAYSDAKMIDSMELVFRKAIQDRA